MADSLVEQSLGVTGTPSNNPASPTLPGRTCENQPLAGVSLRQLSIDRDTVVGDSLFVRRKMLPIAGVGQLCRSLEQYNSFRTA
jgi:hypothetical protein